MTTFLSLPRELRDEIYTYLIYKPTSTIPAFERHRCEFPRQLRTRSRWVRNAAAQPAISRVNHEIRAEVLPLFYQRNDFLVDLCSSTNLEMAKKWLLAIGAANVESLRCLTLCASGWFGMKACMGRRTKYSVWVKVRFDLMRGELEVDGEEAFGLPKGRKRILYDAISQSASTMRKDVGELREFYQSMVEERRREGKAFDGESLSGLMDFFHAFCKEHSLGNLS